MQITETATDPPLRLAELDASELEHNTQDLLGELFSERLLGLVVRGAFPAEGVARVVERLERGACPLREHASRYYKGYSYGRILVISAPDLADYFAEAAEFPPRCAALFEGTLDFQPRIEALLRAATGGRATVRVPRGPAGQPYAAASVRGVVSGGEIDLHCENETTHFPPMRHLTSAVIDATAQLSYYLTLQTPEQGGALHVHNVRHGTSAAQKLERMGRSGEAVLQILKPYGEAVPQLGAGDLVVFNAGRYFHRVTPITGARTRWTMGGFVARARDGRDGVYYWS